MIAPEIVDFKNDLKEVLVEIHGIHWQYEYYVKEKFHVSLSSVRGWVNPKKPTLPYLENLQGLLAAEGPIDSISISTATMIRLEQKFFKAWNARREQGPDVVYADVIGEAVNASIPMLDDAGSERHDALSPSLMTTNLTAHDGLPSWFMSKRYKIKMNIEKRLKDLSFINNYGGFDFYPWIFKRLSDFYNYGFNHYTEFWGKKVLPEAIARQDWQFARDCLFYTVSACRLMSKTSDDLFNIIDTKKAQSKLEGIILLLQGQRFAYPYSYDESEISDLGEATRRLYEAEKCFPLDSYYLLEVKNSLSNIWRVTGQRDRADQGFKEVQTLAANIKDTTTKRVRPWISAIVPGNLVQLTISTPKVRKTDLEKADKILTKISTGRNGLEEASDFLTAMILRAGISLELKKRDLAWSLYCTAELTARKFEQKVPLDGYFHTHLRQEFGLTPYSEILTTDKY